MNMLTTLALAAFLAAQPFGAAFAAYSYDDPAKNDGESCPGNRIIAIGDTHGDYETFEKLLRSPEVGILNDKLDWIGDKNCLVITGDMFDRGKNGFKILDLLMRLEGEAARAGGRVLVSLGNHEVMNLMGDWGGVPADEYKALENDDKVDYERKSADFKRFVMSDKPEVKSDFYEEYTAELAGGDQKARETSSNLFMFLLRGGDWESARKKFEDKVKDVASSFLDTNFPRGYFARRALLAPTGKYGSWLLAHPIINKLNGVLFMHGGLSKTWSKKSVETLNREASDGLRDFFEARETLVRKGVFHSAMASHNLFQLAQKEIKRGGGSDEVKKAFQRIVNAQNTAAFAGDGPLWYRGLTNPNAQNQEGFNPNLENEVKEILKDQKAKRIVIGHTVTKSKMIESPVEGYLVIMIDTGMSKAYMSGTPSVLELVPGQDTVRTFSSSSKYDQGRPPIATWTKRQQQQPQSQPQVQPPQIRPGNNGGGNSKQPSKTFTNVDKPNNFEKPYDGDN